MVALIAAAARTTTVLRRSGKHELAAHILVPPLVTMASLMVLGSFVLPRYISFLVVPIAVACAIAVDSLLNAAPQSILRVAVVVLVVSGGWSLVGRSSTMTVAWENYEEASNAARAAGADQIFVNRTSSIAGFQYYSGSTRFVPSAAELCGMEGPFVLIDYPIGDAEPLPACFTLVEAIADVRQRARPGHIAVFVLDSG